MVCECPLETSPRRKAWEISRVTTPGRRANTTAGISERPRWKWKIAKCIKGRWVRGSRGGGPGIRVHWPICGATTPAPGSDALQVHTRSAAYSTHTDTHAYFPMCCASRALQKVNLKGHFQSWRRLERCESLRGFGSLAASVTLATLICSCSYMATYFVIVAQAVISLVTDDFRSKPSRGGCKQRY